MDAARSSDAVDRSRARAHAGVDPNELISALDRSLGLRITRADGRRVEATMAITQRHLQAHGIVHGGVYCTVIETLASIGATLRAGLDQQVVGLSNRTSFVRALRSGEVTISAELADSGDDVQFWSVRITDGEGRLVATGQVQLMRLRDPGDDRQCVRPDGQK